MTIGSSPLARGLHPYACGRDIDGRIIPARAGFTLTFMTTRFLWWDHPRSRGVYRVLDSLTDRAQGSSPLARGLLPGGLSLRVRGRIIPARAGFTGKPHSQKMPPRDHPRSRGVYAALYCLEMKDMGSSPLARGLPHEPAVIVAEGRIIPARAGFTTRAGRHCRGRQDHPRSRGVYFAQKKPVVASQGSSPLARGLRKQRRARQGR